MNLESDLSVLKGVGPKKKELLKNYSIHTIADLLCYFPRRYLDRNLTDSILLKSGEVVTLIVTVIDSYLAHGRKTRLLVGVKTKNQERITLAFFSGVSYFQKVFQTGMNLVISGKLEYFRGLQISHPDYEILSSDSEDDLIHLSRIIPLYPTTETLKKEGLDSRGFRRIIKQIVDQIDSNSIKIEEALPRELIKKRELISRKLGFKEIHFPSSDETLLEAKRRFAYEEFFYFNLLMKYKKEEREKVKRVLWALPKSKTADKILNSLPFSLTEDQKSSIDKILKLIQTDKPIATLLQGDVGSGKTITSLLIATHYMDNSIQVCILAPTEVLARQHFATIQNLLSHTPFMSMDLFVGKEKEKIRKEKLARLKEGETLLVIGTHSLLQEDVLFKDLGLVIIDEQHKFGVEQRETIRKKGKNPDILAMTATPIPRTLSLTLYGDLELITIKSKPKGRKEIQTKWFQEEKRTAVYNSLKKYLEQGRQAYIIYPLVEESEKVDLQSCIDAYEELRKIHFKEYNVGLLHGKMSSNDKDRIMSEFKSGKIHVLIATTVVEVGIDVPNATVLLIEHADRYGISQLHQLRGRVGRGEHESFCILITSDKVSDEAKIRLQAMTNSTDGFYLAEVDLKLRGPGELLGLRQSGLPDFKIADFEKDEDLIIQTREDVLEFGKIGDVEKLEIRNRFSEGRILFPN
jgi:ATP-dependent DNA helicase RecG